MSILIDVFRDDFFKNLEQYNEVLIDALGKHKFNNEGINHVWFSPIGVHNQPLTTDEDGVPSPLVKDPKFNLFLYCANYPALFVINLLYNERKSVLVEDFPCGSGNFIYYLSKLGFDNFSLIDDFTQVKKEVFDDAMKLVCGGRVINDYRAEPIVLNSVGLPWFYRRLPLSAELICIYPHKNFLESFIPHMKQRGYKELCWDSDKLQVFLCRPDKYDEFSAKIAQYKV